MTHATRLIAAACIAVVAALLVAGPAFAHSDQGAMTAEAGPGPQPRSLTARARLVFADDGHAANDAAVTVTGTGPGGAPVGPTQLSRVDEGEYEVVVALPVAGDWSLQFTSTNPAATVATTSMVAAPPSQAPVTRPATRATRGGDDDSSGLDASMFAIAGGAVAVAAVAGGVVLVRRRR
jgi:hypothetical protein